MRDPFSLLIKQAVDAAISARLPEVVSAIKETLSESSRGGREHKRPERFIGMCDLEEILNADRSTIRRRSLRGVYPPLRKLGASVGFFQSDLDRIFRRTEPD